ncbi:S-adenosyl-L-methionine-dependent methyltransferases superfamily protein [Klebsormidium nitens]|uniref:DNA (cytosine-5-)-methyltransferase n=1 Tax=Klebsormidium nitens TaxID=105231 RepID=A0A1Y1I024_KLENI|nr:S-adenosyl-L-methionine-dependent methyltransferases superfamily protein [Klebsormidium nitens]|eukprot:GAQ81458.1 S-adenosyl-L-methionine-dependent methyltransferases superfamily protein [Klebsormidium nitens]
MDQEARWRAGWRPHEEFVNIPLRTDWLSELRRQHPWKGDGLVVVSMFDGMGGCWQALKALGIPVKKGYSCEIKEFANAVVKERFPDVIHLGSVTAVTQDMIPEPVDLIVAGFPCQDLSSMGNQRGLHGARSGLFFHIPRFISMFKAKWFLVENVKCRWQDQAEITKYLLNVLPLELDAEELSPQSRVRNYWTNLPLPPNLPGIRDAPETSVQHFLENAIAPFVKTGTVMTTNNDANTSNCALKSIYDLASGGARYLEVEEIEAMMGYSAGYSKIPYNKHGCILPFSSSKKQSGRRRCSQGGASEGANGGGAEGPPQKRLKFEEGGASGTEAGAEKEAECDGAQVGKEEPTGDELGKGIIALSSDEDDVVFQGEAAAVEEGEDLPGGHSAEGDVGANEPPGKSALPLTWLGMGAQGGPDEAGSSGLSNEEKSVGGGEKSPGYGLRARKPVNYAAEHVEIDDVSPGRRPTPKRRSQSTPRRKLLSPGSSGEALFATKDLRWELLGNSFVVPCIAYMLSQLLSPQLRARAQRIMAIPTPDVKDACLFKEGEVWALYNEDMAPNWYACVTHVDVTQPDWDGRKKLPTQFGVHYRFYEYLPSSENPKSPIQGVGILKLACEDYTSVDKAFSHRVNPAHLEGGRILVYPRGGEVWVVKDRLRKFGRFKLHVYIVKSTADPLTGQFECTIRILVSQPRSTSKTPIYRMAGGERVLSGGRTVFSYQVPYFFKNEAGLFYVEPQYDQTVAMRRRRLLEWDDDEDDVAAEEEELGRGEEVLEPEAEYPASFPETESAQKLPTLAEYAPTSQALQLVAPDAKLPQLNALEDQNGGPAQSSAQAPAIEQALASRKGKEKIDVSDSKAQADDVAGVLPSEGRGLLEERTVLKCRDIHVLMDLLPRL